MAESLSDLFKEELSPLRIEIVESQKARIELLKYKLIAVAALGAIGLGVSGYQTDLNTCSINPEFVMCIIPFFCIYVDLLCWHNTLRILIIARFLNSNNDPYELFLSKMGSFLFNIGLYLLLRKKEGFYFKKKLSLFDILDKESNKYVSSSEMTNYLSGKQVSPSEKRKISYKRRTGYFFELEDWALHWSSIFLSILLGIWGLHYFYHYYFYSDTLTLKKENLVVNGVVFFAVSAIGISLSLVMYKAYDKRMKALFLVVEEEEKRCLDVESEES